MIEPITACIADKTIELRFPILPMANNWAPFLVKNGECPVIQTIEMSADPFMMPFYGVSFLRENLCGRIAQDVSDPRALMNYSEDFRHVTINGPSDAAFELIITAFYSRLSRLEPCMLMHASAVKHEGEAVLFIGPSGIGKTTQAELWEKHLKAEILNGDKVFLRAVEGRPTAYGSPWAGSSPYIVNDSANLKGLVLLKQGPHNEIKKLTNLFAFQSLAKHTFIPQWDKQCTANVIQMLSIVLQCTPVFILTCRKDEEAALITKQAVWGH